MEFYEFTDGSPCEKRWTFAVSIHPRSPVVQWYCEECGSAANYPSGAFDVTVEGGSEFPDVLGSGQYPLLILSERFVSVLKAANIFCFQEHRVGVAKVSESPLQHEKCACLLSNRDYG